MVVGEAGASPQVPGGLENESVLCTEIASEFYSFVPPVYKLFHACCEEFFILLVKPIKDFTCLYLWITLKLDAAECFLEGTKREKF